MANGYVFIPNATNDSGGKKISSHMFKHISETDSIDVMYARSVSFGSMT